MLSVVVRDEDTGGKVVAVLALADKVFSSGKPGYFGQGKVEIGGVRYQAQFQLVRIGAPDAEAESEG